MQGYTHILNYIATGFTVLEYTAVFYGVLYVLLAAKGDVWCWWAGIVSSAIYIYINIYSRLYMDAILQTYYVLAGFYGWWLWSFKAGKAGNSLPVISYSLLQNVWPIVCGLVLFPPLGYLFSKVGNSYPYADAAVTVFSFVATWMTAKKIMENWLYWIAIDLVAAVLYSLKDLRATSGLYILFTIMAVYGYMEWKKDLKKA